MCLCYYFTKTSINMQIIDIKKLAIVIIYMTLSLFAKGVIAGKEIQNGAKIEFTLNGISYSESSNTDSFVVDQIIDIKLKWQNTKPVNVSSGERHRVLTFLLVNEGNGEDSINLSYEHNSSSNFVPANAKIYADSDGDGVFDSAADSEVSAVNLEADKSVTLFIVADIPDGNYTANEESFDSIIAKSQKTINKGTDRKNKIDIVIRKSTDKDTGIYKIRNYYLISKKKQTIISNDGKVHTGTVIRYSIELFLGGDTKNKSIQNINVKDKLDAALEYLNGSLKLNGRLLSDENDNDEGYVKDGTVFAHIGKLKDNEKAVVSFDAVVK